MSGLKRRIFFAALFGIAAGTGALLGAATVTARPPLFLLAGLFAFCTAYLLGLLFVTRKVSASRRQRLRIVWFCTGAVLIVGAFALAVLIPMGDPRLPPAPVAG